jgi:hypothetical protein
MSTYWASVDVEWLDGRTETYKVGGYARENDAVQVKDGVLSLYMGNSAYGAPDHLASIPLGGLRCWQVKPR